MIPFIQILKLELQCLNVGYWLSLGEKNGNCFGEVASESW